jgi:hypothetical protein
LGGWSWRHLFASRWFDGFSLIEFSAASCLAPNLRLNAALSETAATGLTAELVADWGAGVLRPYKEFCERVVSAKSLL